MKLSISTAAIVVVITIAQLEANLTIKPPFSKDLYDVYINDSYWCSSDLELFRPNLTDTNSLEYKYSIISSNGGPYQVWTDPFRIDHHTGSLFINLKHRILKSNHYFMLKLVANSPTNRWETVVSVRVSPILGKQCGGGETVVKPVAKKLKLLFADSFDSYDFNRLFRASDDSGSEQVEEIRLSEDLLVGSFICYVLVRSNLDLKLIGPDSDTFSLEKVHSGSTLLLTFDGPTEANSIRPVINLFTLKLDKELDRESKSNYRLDIVLFEKSKPSESKQLNIIVTDVNDNEPKFEADLYRFELVENNPVNINLGRVVAFDRDLDENGTLEYFLPAESLVSYNSSGLAETGGDANKIVKLDENTGELIVHSSLDRELYFKYRFEVCARDQGRRVQLRSQPCARIEVTLLDLNDNRPQFYLFYGDTDVEVSNHRPLDFYLEENCTENTFIAWLKAFDNDAGENATIVYSLNSSSPVPFWIDPHGIVRNTKRIRLIEDGHSESSPPNTYLTRQRNFLVKVSVTDSSKDPRNRMSTSIELNLRIVDKSDKNEPSGRITTPNNETIFYINRKQHTYNLSQPITRIVVNEASNSSASSSYSYQMVPLMESEFEYGENCSQSEIIKYFRLNKQGEIYLASYLLNSTAAFQKPKTRSKASQLLSLNMICFVNIRVLDLRNPFKLTTSKELVFIIYDIDNRSLDDLIKLKFLKKISFIKSKHLQMSRSGSASSLRNLYGKNLLSLSASPSSPIYSISSAAFNYTDDEMRKFASFALEKLNQSLLGATQNAPPAKTSNSALSSSQPSYSVFLFIFIVLSISVFVILFGYRLVVSLSTKRRQKSALNALLAKLNQTSKLDSKPTSNKNKRISFKLFIKDLNSFRVRYFTVRLPKLGRREEASNSSSTSSSSCGASQFKQVSENKYTNSYLIKNEILTNENDGIYKGPEEKTSNSSSTDSLSNIYSNLNVKIKAAAAAAAATGGQTTIPEDDTTGKDATSVMDNKQGNSDNSGVYSMPLTLNNNKSSMMGQPVNKLTNLCLNESASSFINKNISVTGSGRKMSYGIYQVANQILIDYDDEDGGGTENDHKNLSPSLEELTDCSIKSAKKINGVVSDEKPVSTVGDLKDQGCQIDKTRLTPEPAYITIDSLDEADLYLNPNTVGKKTYFSSFV